MNKTIKGNEVVNSLRVKKYAKYILAIIIIFLAINGFLRVWYDKATNISITEVTTKTEDTGVIYVDKSDSIIVDHYVFWQTRCFISIESVLEYLGGIDIGGRFLHGIYVDLEKTWEEIRDTFVDNDCYIIKPFKEYSVQLFYGDEPITPLQIVHFNESIVSSEWMYGLTYLTFADSLTVPPFSKLAIEVKWGYSYNKTWTHKYGSTHYVPDLHLYMDSSIREPYSWRSFGEGYFYYLIQLTSFPGNITLPFIVFVLTGFFAAWIKNEQLKNIVDTHEFLSRANKTNHVDVVRLESILIRLPLIINQLGFGYLTLLAPAISLYKIIVRRKVSRLILKNKLESLGWEEPLETFMSDSATQPKSILFEWRFLSVAIGFITSIGITFSWNVGAVAPLIFAFGLMYIFVNLGVLIFLVRKTTDVRQVLIVIIVVYIISIFPEIFNFMQGQIVREWPLNLQSFTISR
jgi:hypothetical protein